MGQSALILTLAATLTIIVILIVVGQTTRDTDSELAQYQYKVFAREVASTGLNMTVRRLVEEPYRWSDATWPYGYPETPHRGGNFTTTITPLGIMVENFYGWDQDTVDVVSIGAIPTSGGDTTHVIEARYVKGYEDFGLPPGLKKAIFAEETLSLNGGADVASADPTEDVVIHADGELMASGTPVNVYGIGTVGDGSDGDDPAAYDHIKPNEEAIFDPVDPDAVELVFPDAPIYLPPVDAAAMDNEIAHSPFEGHSHVDVGGPGNTYTFSGDTLRVSDYAVDYGCTCGTPDDPLLIYVNGDLVIGNMIVEGYVQFVVTGSITFNGSVTVYTDANGDGVPDPEPDSGTQEWDDWMAGQLDASDNTTIGYYAEGDITANGNFSLVGQLYANGDVTLNGGGGNEVNIIGGVTSTLGNVTTNGDVNIWYAALSEIVLTPGLHYIVPEGVRLIAYAEW